MLHNHRLSPALDALEYVSGQDTVGSNPILCATGGQACVFRLSETELNFLATFGFNVIRCAAFRIWANYPLFFRKASNTPFYVRATVYAVEFKELPKVHIEHGRTQNLLTLSSNLGGLFGLLMPLSVLLLTQFGALWGAGRRSEAKTLADPRGKYPVESHRAKRVQFIQPAAFLRLAGNARSRQYRQNTVECRRDRQSSADVPHAFPLAFLPAYE